MISKACWLTVGREIHISDATNAREFEDGYTHSYTERIEMTMIRPPTINLKLGALPARPIPTNMCRRVHHSAVIRSSVAYEPSSEVV